MKLNLVIVGMTVLLLMALPSISQAQVNVSLGLEFHSVGNRGNGYYASLGESYGVPHGDICMMREAGVADADMPTILYIYAHSQYSLRQIYSLRLRGATWEQLSNWCGVPLYRDGGRLYSYRSGPPYGNAYGYYRHGPGRGHYEGRFSDDDGFRGHGRY